MRVINEQDVFDIIDDLRDRMTVEGYCAMIERVKALPSAQPERTGRWMATEADEPCFYRCSECGRLIDERENFCPNCGARLEGENEND